MSTTKKVPGMTITQAAVAWNLSKSYIRKLISKNKLRVLYLTNGKKNGRGGDEPLLVLILDKEPPAPKF